MIIGIDIDDTITNSSDVFIKYAEIFNSEIGNSQYINIEELDQYKAFGWDESCQKDFSARYMRRIFEDATPHTKAVEVINMLHREGNKIVLISARSDSDTPDVYEITCKWLKQQKVEYDCLVLNCTDKIKGCRENMVDIFVDDNFANCFAVRSALSIPVFMYATRYNKKYFHSHIELVNLWDEIYSKIKERSMGAGDNREELEFVEVDDRCDFPAEPSGYRFVHFYNGVGSYRGYLVPEDLSRADFMEKYPQYVPEHNRPIYEHGGIILRADPKFPCPGFYILSLDQTYRAFDLIDDITFLRFSFILKKAKEGMRKALGINYAHLLSNEKSDPFVNVHFWLVPINGITSPDLLDFDVKEYLHSFEPHNEIEKIKTYNKKLREYFTEINLEEQDDMLKNKLI